MIEIRNVTKAYTATAEADSAEIRALDDVSLHVAAGEWVAVTGPSGSGKTTLVNLIGCLDQPTRGSVLIDGEDVGRMNTAELTRARAEKIGLIFQQFHMIPYLTALENVMLAQYFHSMVDENEAKSALEHVGLGHRAHHLPAHLSGGEQQRVCIARALINDPKIILADEPTGNLDAQNEEIVLRLLRELHHQGRTIVMVTHDPVVARLADRRVELHHGRIALQELFAMSDEQHFDELLEEIWTTLEQGDVPELGRLLAPGALPNAIAIERMARMDLLTLRDHPPEKHAHKAIADLCHAFMKGGARVVDDGPQVIELTERGRQRAEDIVRRHRLAERLFTDTLHVKDAAEVESQACKFEHVLSEDAADRICALLGHPVSCPHGAPIPKGKCCKHPMSAAV